MMERIIWNTENHQAYRSIIDALEPIVDPSIHHAVSEAAADVANMIGATAIVAFTSRGTTAYRIARKRPEVQILSATTDISHRAPPCPLMGRPQRQHRPHDLEL